jgi:regulator of sirC expression with transglutaminase-like and TPR domain
LAAILGLAALLPNAVSAQTKAEIQQRYDACMQQAREAPADGLATALAWEEQGGGLWARHCAAVSMIGQNRFKDAATEMEAIADEMTGADTTDKVRLLRQAGQVWMMAEDIDRAIAVQTRGLEIAPTDLELLVDRGLTLGYQKKFWEALDDFNLARAQAPERADILTYMGTAYRYLEAYDLALELIEEALRLEPDNPDTLLERGIIRRLNADNDGARADWIRVVELAPNSPPADAARKNLESLDAPQ